MKVPILLMKVQIPSSKRRRKGAPSVLIATKDIILKKYCFKKKMDIMTQFLKRKNIDVPDSVRKKELEKPTDLKEQCHDAHHQGN